MTSASALRSLLEISVLGLLRMAASLLVLAVLWWPFFAAAIVGAWRVFEKAGRPGWACLVPGYNAVEFLRIAKLPRWLSVALFVPGVNAVLFVVACVRVARAFRKDRRFAAGLVLLPPVYMASLGFSSARYRRFELLDGARGAKPRPVLPRSSEAEPMPELVVPERALGVVPGDRQPGRDVLRVVRGPLSDADAPGLVTGHLHTLDLG